jgi:hypothetical protein
MLAWEYDITAYSIEQVLAMREQAGLPEEQDRPIMFCTDKGACFFDNIPNSNIQIILEMLNGKGAEGWQLVDVNFRGDEMICFWKREVPG